MSGLTLEAGVGSGLTPTQRLAAYKELSKSGIVALVLISVLGGYLAGHPSEMPFHFQRMILTLVGVLFLASGSSALNQLQEREVDARMPRTAGRPLPSGRLGVEEVTAFVVFTIASGALLLAWLDTSVALLGIAAVLSYNGLYTMWWKKHWSFAAVPGAVPGALPILMGYTAASGTVLAPGGIYLFSLLFFWQMPHFWVLALRFRDDYEKGRFPTLPVTHGQGVTLSQIVLWCLAYVGLALVAPVFLRVGTTYLCLALPMGLKVLWELRSFVREPESRRWLHFFLWVNLSLIVYIAAAALDLWRLTLMTPYLTR